MLATSKFVRAELEVPESKFTAKNKMWCFLTCGVVMLLLDTHVRLMAAYENSHQFPVELPDFGTFDEKPRPMHQKRVGDPCLNSDECRKKLCCVRRNGGRSCQRRAKHCQRCREDQMMGGYYHQYCPCRKDQGECHMLHKKNYGICY